MKNCLLCFAFVLVTLSSGFAERAHAQNDWGVRFSPILVLVGFFDVSVDLAVTDNIVVSPEFQYWSLDFGDFSWRITGVGGFVNYHIDSALSDSWYFGAGARTFNITAEDSTTDEEGSLSTVFIGARAGYVWVWENFYLNLGGVAGSLADTKITVENTTTSVETEEDIPTYGIGVGLDFKLGWSF